MTFVQPEMDVTVYGPKYFNNIAASLSYSLCSSFSVILAKLHILKKWQLNAQAHYTPKLRNSQFPDEATLLYDPRIVQNIRSWATYCTA